MSPTASGLTVNRGWAGKIELYKLLVKFQHDTLSTCNDFMKILTFLSGICSFVKTESTHTEEHSCCYDTKGWTQTKTQKTREKKLNLFSNMRSEDWRAGRQVSSKWM